MVMKMQRTWGTSDLCYLLVWDRPPDWKPLGIYWTRTEAERAALLVLHRDDRRDVRLYAVPFAPPDPVLRTRTDPGHGGPDGAGQGTGPEVRRVAV